MLAILTWAALPQDPLRRVEYSSSSVTRFKYGKTDSSSFRGNLHPTNLDHYQLHAIVMPRFMPVARPARLDRCSSVLVHSGQRTAARPCATVTLSMLTYYRTSRSLHFPFWADVPFLEPNWNRRSGLSVGTHQYIG
jgi:hypothetical protein